MRWAVRLTKPVLLLVAFTLAMVLYLYVQSQTAPTDTKTVPLVVKGKNLADGLIFDQDGETVDFTATGPRDKLDQLIDTLKSNPNYVTAVANLKFISPNNVRDRFDIEAVHLTVKKPSDLGIDFVQEKRLRGEVERPKTRAVKVKVEFESPPTPGAWADYDKDSYEVSPSSIELTGPASDVNDANLTVVVNPQVAEQDQVVRVPVTIPNNLVSNPRVDYVEVRPTRHERQVYVNVHFTGHLPAGYSVSNFYVVSSSGSQSSTTAIRGPSGIVDKTAAIEASVDISGLKRGFTFMPIPQMPRQVELVEAPLRIRVDVEHTRP